MNDEIEIRPQVISPLKKICMTIGELPTSYLETMTYYEMLVWFANYLRDTVIPVVNNNGEAVTELQNLFVELQTYVNNYFDNLDVQEEINNKLDDMLEDGTLEQIIEQFIQSSALWCFDNVADMKSATNLVNGSYAKTYGYYERNDGGSAFYKIRTKEESETTDEKFLVALSDTTLVADLMTLNSINVRQIGAYGDNTHDDSSVLQYAFNKAEDYTIVIPKGTYLISSGLTLNGVNVFIEGENANIVYSGTDYALTSTYLRFGTIKIGDITASSGGCIKLNVTSSSNQFVYDNIYFRTFSASTNCVFAHCEGGGWINEIRWFNGKLVAGQYGFNIEHDFTGAWGNNAINGWHFNNIGIEGVTTGFYLNAISGHIEHFDFNGLRHAESFTTLLKTTGVVYQMDFFGCNMITDTWLDLSADTRNINIYGTVNVDGVKQENGYINDGVLVGYNNRNLVLNGGLQFASNTDLNTVLQPGTYTSNSNWLTQSISNKPSEITGGAFKLVVIESTNILRTKNPATAYLLQIFFTTGANTNIYFRKCEVSNSTPTFGSWKAITSTALSS